MTSKRSKKTTEKATDNTTISAHNTVKHAHCQHVFGFCNQCDVVYCNLCSEEWGKHKYVYSYPCYPYYPYTTNTYSSNSFTCGDPIVSPIGSHTDHNNV